MADTCSANIRITGTIMNSTVLAGLVAAAYDDGVTSYMGRAIDQAEIKAKIYCAPEKGDALEFYNEYSRGAFPKLESYCQTAGLSYVRTNGGGDGITPMSSSWVPGMLDAADGETSSSGAVVVNVDELAKLLDLPDTEMKEALRKIVQPKLAASGIGAEGAFQFADGVRVPEGA